MNKPTFALAILLVILAGCSDNSSPYYAELFMNKGANIALKCQRLEREDFTLSDCIDQLINKELILQYGSINPDK